jgi:hypothetical protein
MDSSKKRDREEDPAQATEGVEPPKAKRVKISERDELKEYLHFTIISAPCIEGGCCPETYVVRHKEEERASALVTWLQTLQTADKDAHDLVANTLYHFAKTNSKLTLEEAVKFTDDLNEFVYKLKPANKIANDALLATLLAFDVGHWEKVETKHDTFFALPSDCKSVRFAYIYDWS